MNEEEIKNQFEDLQASIDELIERLDGIDDENADQEQRLADSEDQAGQLSYPLSQETIDLIKEQFPNSSVGMIGGTVTINDIRISPFSTILYSRGLPSGTLGHLSITTQTVGSATITSTSATESSIIYYLLL